MSSDSELYALRSAFEKLHTIIANTLWTVKKALQLSSVGAAWYFYGQWVAAAVLAFLVVIEALDAGYEKVLELKAEVKGL